MFDRDREQVVPFKPISTNEEQHSNISIKISGNLAPNSGNSATATASKMDIATGIDVINANRSNGNPSSLFKILTIQAALALGFTMVGWYYPRYLIDQALPEIAQKNVPYQTTQAGDVILDSVHNQPLIDPPTIPSSFLIFTSVWIPLFSVAAVALLQRHPTPVHKWHDLHASICGLASTIGLSEAVTHILKLYMQQRRPNFYALCQFDVAKRACTASISKIGEANLTFPSGHSSLSCCAMTFLVWFFLGKLFSVPVSSVSFLSSSIQTKRVLGLLACIIPWGWTIFVAASRVADYWHHPADVVAGLLLGGSTGTMMYHFWYPPVFSPASFVGIPWSFHHYYRRPNAMEAKLPSFHE
ncbi:hypothetical protein ACA910_000340 [Epithemia clementina (nom. ined.)]